jgi:hypothetical protein
MNESVYYYYILLFLYFVYHNVKPMSGGDGREFIKSWL